MILSIDKKEFGDKILLATKFTEQRSATLPVLGGVLIFAEKDEIRIRATNLETTVDLKLSGMIKTKGSVVLPAATLREVASSFSGGGPLTLEHAKDVVFVSSGSAKSTLKTLPLDDFPSFPLFEGEKNTFTISGASFKELISFVASCASTSTIRPELSAVYIRAAGGTLTSAATDSFRLAEKKISGANISKQFSVLIPAKNAADILHALPDTEITITNDEHVATLAWEEGVVGTRLITVAYPDYTQIIPKSFSGEATVLRKDFEGGLKRTAIFSDAYQKVRLQFDGAHKKLLLSARNTDVGEGSESLSASLTGEAIELSFNHRYLQTPLTLLTSESITLSASGIGRPLVIRGVGDASFLYLVMPMNQ